MSKIFQLAEPVPTVEDIIDLLSEVLVGKPVGTSRYIIETHIKQYAASTGKVIVELDDGTTFAIRVK